MSSAEIQVNSEWLKWARKTAYYEIEEISRKMRVNKDTMENWENTGAIDYDHLLKLAEFYHRPPMMFFNKNDPERVKTIIPDFRTIDSNNQEHITPEISFEIRSARNRRENLLILEEEFEEFELPSFDFDIPNDTLKDTEALAWIIRDYVGMNTAKMLLHKNQSGLDYWIQKLEELGVLIFQFYGIKPEVMRGYALTYDKLPIIGINNQDHPNGKKFTLFHELAHIISKKEGISTFDSYLLPNEDESFCNAVAAEVLVPQKILRDKIVYFDGDWTEQKIDLLKRFFGVSAEVIVRRLLTLGLVTRDYYNNKREEWENFIPHSRTGSRRVTTQDNQQIKGEPEIEKEPDPEKINARKASMALKRNGIYYTEIVLSAYDSQFITNSTMAGYLGETLQVIEEIRKKLPEEMVE